MPHDVFQENLAFGKIGESDIACWVRARNSAVLPVYEKEIEEGKGPRLFGGSGEHVAPDMLVFPIVEWLEAKHKSVWSWHRLTQRWVTGIDLNHYRGYQDTQRESGRRVWLFFLHRCDQPHPRDLNAGSPRSCPTGLFGGTLDYLERNQNHTDSRWGRHGMVYWSSSILRQFATLAEVQEAKDKILQRYACAARLA